MEYDKNRLNNMSASIAALTGETAAIDMAAALLAEAARHEKMIHVFGVDVRAADIEGELFFRAGGLACIDPIYDPAFANSHGAYRSELCRPLDGLTPKILEYYEYVESRDPLVLLTFDPDSTAYAQAVAWAKEKCLTLITVIPQSPKSQEIAALPDVTIPFGLSYQTLCMTAVLDEMMARTIERCPGAEVWQGDFFPDGEKNREAMEHWRWRIRHL